MIINAKICIVAMMAGSCVGIYPHLHITSSILWFLYLSLFASLTGLLVWATVKTPLQPVSIRAYMLTICFYIGIYIVMDCRVKYRAFGLQICIVSLFHMGEYLTTALCQPSSLTLESFILNHSSAYNIAMSVAFVEHLTTVNIFPSWHAGTTRVYIGLFLALFGDFVRKLSMVTAGESFSHFVRFIKKEDHILITNGIYSLVRHPSYAGWFCWSVSTQVMLGNPACFIGFIVVSWKFFDERILNEEQTLLYFFGKDYADYQSRVPFTGVPYVKGYKLDDKDAQKMKETKTN